MSSPVPAKSVDVPMTEPASDSVFDEQLNGDRVDSAAGHNAAAAEASNGTLQQNGDDNDGETGASGAASGRIRKKGRSTTTKFPLQRIKKIVKMDEEIQMLSTSAALIISGAAEKFATYFTEQAYLYATAEGKRGLQYRHCAKAVSRVGQLEFLADVVPSTVTFGEVKKRRQEADEEVRELGGNVMPPIDGERIGDPSIDPADVHVRKIASDDASRAKVAAASASASAVEEEEAARAAEPASAAKGKALAHPKFKIKKPVPDWAKPKAADSMTTDATTASTSAEAATATGTNDVGTEPPSGARLDPPAGSVADANEDVTMTD
ncbi:hypothetical protein PYCC9005_005970 [Savitreella phatthalungensis]